MKLNDAARELIGDGTDATLVTLNPDGSPQVDRRLGGAGIHARRRRARLGAPRRVPEDPQRPPRPAGGRHDPVHQAPRCSRRRTWRSPARPASSRAARPSCSRSWPRRCSAATSTSRRRMRRRDCSPASGSTRSAASAPGRPDARSGCNTFQFVPSCLACVAGSCSSSPCWRPSPASSAPPASAEGTPIGNLGDTLRVEFKGIVADVTVHDCCPSILRRSGYAATGSPR